jgi:hypothetical protein
MPIQAVDYWLLVRRHQREEVFQESPVVAIPVRPQLFQSQARYIYGWILLIPFRGNMFERNLKRAPLACRQRLSIRRDEDFGFAQDYLIQIIAEFHGHFHRADGLHAIVRNRSCYVGEFLLQKIVARAIWMSVKWILTAYVCSAEPNGNFTAVACVLDRMVLVSRTNPPKRIPTITIPSRNATGNRRRSAL